MKRYHPLKPVSPDSFKVKAKVIGSTLEKPPQGVAAARLSHHSGFTLIELMLALALGLLVSAAAIMLFLTGQKSVVMQQGSADLQDNANFGLSYMVRDLRLINLNAPAAQINDRTKDGGIVFTSKANPVEEDESTYSNLPSSIDNAPLALLSGGAVGPSNVEVESDQLVIQYKPQYIQRGTDWFGGFDCEGNEIRFPMKTGTGAAETDTPLRIYVQRYFLREDANKATNEPNNALALACDAGWYPEAGDPTKIEGYGEKSQIIMQRVDYFHVMLGVQNNDERLRYISIDDYMKLTTVPKPRVLSIQLGALARSMQSVGNDNIIKNDQKYQVLDKEVTVTAPTGSPPKYARQVVAQTVALRNTFGERGQ